MAKRLGRRIVLGINAAHDASACLLIDGEITVAVSEERLSRNAAMGRLVDPIEVAQAIAWLLGPASSAVTGINLPVDAGFLAGATWDAYGGLRGPKAKS